MTEPDHEPTGVDTAEPGKKPTRRRKFDPVATTAPTADYARPAAAQAPAEPAAAPPVDPDMVAPAPTPKAAAAPAATGKPIRVTVELEFDEHRQLRRLCDRYADEIGVAQVAGAETFRALLQLALADEAVAKKLGKALARTGGSRRHT